MYLLLEFHTAHMPTKVHQFLISSFSVTLQTHTHKQTGPKKYPPMQLSWYRKDVTSCNYLFHLSFQYQFFSTLLGLQVLNLALLRLLLLLQLSYCLAAFLLRLTGLLRFLSQLSHQLHLHTVTTVNLSYTYSIKLVLPYLGCISPKLSSLRCQLIKRQLNYRLSSSFHFTNVCLVKVS